MKKYQLSRLFLCIVVCCFNLCFVMTQTVFAQDSSNSARIIGGKETNPGDYPWMTALIQSGGDAYADQFCGGTLIAPQWVVTAAHCTDGERAADIEVIVGIHDLTSEEGERIAVQKIFQHKLYDSWTTDADISLLLLEYESSYTTVNIIAPKDPEQLAVPFTEATIIGWGNMLSSGTDYPEVLMEAVVPILPSRVARRIFGSDFTINMMAAGYGKGGVDTCQGDSGGPLVVPNADGSDWILAGITSWGEGCALPRSPGIYTDVQRFTPWVERVIERFNAADSQ